MNEKLKKFRDNKGVRFGATFALGGLTATHPEIAPIFRTILAAFGLL